VIFRPGRVDRVRDVKQCLWEDIRAVWIMMSRWGSSTPGGVEGQAAVEGSGVVRSTSYRRRSTWSRGTGGGVSGLGTGAGGIHGGISSSTSGNVHYASSGALERMPSNLSLNSPCTGAGFGDSLRSVRFHESRFWQEESVLLNPDAFQGLQVGDCLQVSDPEHRESCKTARCMRCYLVFKVTSGSFALTTKGSELSLVQELADLYGFSMRTKLTVSRAEVTESVDFVEVTVKGEYVSSSEMWELKLALSGKSTFAGQVVAVSRAPIQIEHILLVDGEEALSGIVTHETKFIFRSKSAQLFWLLQMSREMWDFSMNGQLYFELVLDFILQCLKRWEQAEVEHLLTIALFARGFHLETHDAVLCCPAESEYTDFFRTVIVSRRTSSILRSPDRLIRTLKKEFNDFPTRINWVRESSGLLKDRANFKAGRRVENSNAVDCNILEAMNIAIDELDSSHVDRSLTTTGRNIVVFNAGSGVMRVNRNLARITKRRMMDSGIGADVISVASPPIHIVPLFIYESPFDRETINESSSQENLTYGDREVDLRKKNLSFDGSNLLEIRKTLRDESRLYTKGFSVPDHWLFIRFVGSPSAAVSNENGSRSALIRPVLSPLLRNDTLLSEVSIVEHDAGVFSLSGEKRVATDPLHFETWSLSSSVEARSLGTSGRSRESSFDALTRSRSRISSTAKLDSLPRSRSKLKLGESMRKLESPRQVKSRPFVVQGRPLINVDSRSSLQNFQTMRQLGVSSFKNIDRQSSLRQSSESLSGVVSSPVRNSPVKNGSLLSLLTRGGSLEVAEVSKIVDKKPLNPFKKDQVEAAADDRKLSTNRRRWAHAVPGYDPSVLRTTLVGTLLSSPAASGGLQESEEALRPGLPQDKAFARSWMWKSLTKPAVLPLTTDYGPDERTLRQKSYSEYAKQPYCSYEAIP